MHVTVVEGCPCMVLTTLLEAFGIEAARNYTERNSIPYLQRLDVNVPDSDVERSSLPSSHYYLRSLSRTSGTLLLLRFAGPSRGSRRLSWQRERGGSLGDPPGP